MATAPPKPRIRRRRIVERPRLLRALDRSRAPVRMLVAGPGFGKTILLEQWAPRDDRVVGWYRARRSAADVAVVARGLVAASSEVLPGAGRRLLERLAVTEDPEREAVLLAEMLAEDLQDWPDGAWLVIDDYQHLAVSTACERFVETVVSQAPVRLLLASRERPSWVPGRAILYGDVLEIPQTALAMSTEEAAEVLEGGRPELASGLLALAGGWPAVIGLAGMAPDVDEIDADLPETLYEFFADELYRGLDDTVATGLAILAAMPTVDRELADALLGPERAGQVCGEALALGILDDRDGRLELHPLAAAFLEQRARHTHDVVLRSVAETAFDLFLRRRDWDPAFEVIRTHLLDDQVERLFLAAMDELAFTARLMTLQAWVNFARSRDSGGAIVRVADADLQLRQGRHLRALTLARSVLETTTSTGEVAFRALTVGALAAHVGSDEEEGLDFYARACEVAPDEQRRRRAQLGRLMCLAALERDEAFDLLAELEKSAVRSDPFDQVRLVDKQLCLGFRFGFVSHLADGRRVAELVELVDDPLVRCSFRSMFAWGLVLGSFYQEALHQARLLLEDASECRVDLTSPYGHAYVAAALCGLREYDAALAEIDRAESEARRFNDENGIQNGFAIRTRILLQCGELAEACASEPPELTRAVPSMFGEVIASRALALASIGRIEEAAELSRQAKVATRGIEAAQLCSVVDTVVALRAREPNLVNRCEDVVGEAFRRGAVDMLVTGYRANRDLLSCLASSPKARERLVFLLRRAGDEDLVVEHGTTAAELVDPLSVLSSREREIHALVCEGLSNGEIATRLFISQATAKRHVQNVYNKLGIRSRTALALNAARSFTPPQSPRSAEDRR